MYSEESIKKRKDTAEKKYAEILSKTIKDIRFTDFSFTNYKGELRWMEESSDNNLEIMKGGVGIDGSSVGLMSADLSDVILFPDVDSMRTFNSFNEKVNLFFCKVFDPKGDAHCMDPRQTLQKVIDKGLKMGYTVDMFSELEFFLRDLVTGDPSDKGNYVSVPPMDGCLNYRRELAHAMEDAGIEVKRLHHECGAGQHEIELKLQPVMRNCDNTILSWWLADNIARKYKWYVDKEPKPWTNMAGTGLHQHILLRNASDGSNAMLGNDEGALSEIALQFIAGLIKYSSEIVSVFAQSHQSFLRLKPGHEAPTFTYWGYCSRNAMVRIPKVSKDIKEWTRCEYRAGDSSGSPHLMCAMIYAAGLKGIEEKLVCPKSFEGTMDQLREDPEKETKYGATLLPKSNEECKKILESTGTLVKEVLSDSMRMTLIKLQNKIAVAATK